MACGQLSAGAHPAGQQAKASSLLGTSKIGPLRSKLFYFLLLRVKEKLCYAYDMHKNALATLGGAYSYRKPVDVPLGLVRAGSP